MIIRDNQNSKIDAEIVKDATDRIDRIQVTVFSKKTTNEWTTKVCVYTLAEVTSMKEILENYGKSRGEINAPITGNSKQIVKNAVR